MTPEVTREEFENLAQRVAILEEREQRRAVLWQAQLNILDAEGARRGITRGKDGRAIGA